MALAAEIDAQLAHIRAKGQLRHLVAASHGANGRVEIDGRSYLNLASNDYLGIAANLKLLGEFYRGQTEANLLAAYGMGSAASRLMTGNTAAYGALEQQLAALYSAEAALVFNSGYHINIGLLPALSNKRDLILADKLCHASIIDGLRLCQAKVIRYPHLDYAAIEQFMRQARHLYSKAFLVTESIFSMDGDQADLRELVRLKHAWDASLYVDEAHSVGIRGAQGLGLAEELDVLSHIDLLIGTFGKAYGGQGAFVVCSKLIADYLLNTARSQIFTTALPPVSLSWLAFILQRIPGLGDERQRVATLANTLRQALRELGLRTGGTSNIVPVMIGKASIALEVADKVRAAGYWVHAIRPPTVPQGTSRLRLSLNAALDWQALAPLPGIIKQAI